MNAHNKKPWVAFVLSFFVPGAGLCYLGKWAWGFVNFAVFVGAIVMLPLMPLGREVFDYFHYVVLILMAGSAGFAHAAATSQTPRRAVPPKRTGGAVGSHGVAKPC